MNLVPLMGYRSADTGDCYQQDEQRKCEGRTRHWAMVWWKDSQDKYVTAEFCVITESMPDFCGGMIVYSPRIDIYVQNEWGNSFCSMGAQADESVEIPTGWRSFKEEYAIDLVALTGQEEWTHNQVRAYGMECIAAKVAGEMHSQGKRGFMAADRCHGTMTELAETMRDMGEFVTIPAYNFQVTKIVDDVNKMNTAPVGRPRGIKVRMHTHIHEDWYNTNSGSQVHWLTGNLSIVNSGRRGWIDCYDCGEEYDGADHDECPCCGYMEDNVEEVSLQYPDKVVEVVSSPAYRVRARRYFWRNG